MTRARTALEGSRGFTMGGRLSLTPSVEVGLRRDGSDAETGAGMDVGGGLAFTDTVTGLSLDGRVRTLVVHQADGFSDRGMSLLFGWDWTPSSPLGLTARVAPTWGGQARGGAEALWGNQMAYGMGSHQMHGAGERFDAEVGYGRPMGARFVRTPCVGLTMSPHGQDYRVGYGLGVLEQGKLVGRAVRGLGVLLVDPPRWDRMVATDVRKAGSAHVDELYGEGSRSRRSRGSRRRACGCLISVGDKHLASTVADARSFQQAPEKRLRDVGLPTRDRDS